MKHTSAFIGVGFLTMLLAFNDLLVNTSATGIILSGLATPHINPPPKDMADKRMAATPTALYVQITWGDGLPHDIDVALRCASLRGDYGLATVNFRQLHSSWLVLKQDDLGGPSVINMEKAESNTDVGKVPPLTRCWVNVHLYNTHNGPMPVEGELLAIQDKDNAHEHLIATVPFTLTKPGEELTLLIATWNERSQLLEEVLEKYPATKLAAIMTGR